MNVLRGILSGFSRLKRLLVILFLLATCLTLFGATKAHASGGCCTGITSGTNFVHTSTSANTSSFTTVIDDHLTLTAQSELFVTATIVSGSVSDPHPLGVQYTGQAWIILNEDQATMPVGATFNVWVSPNGNYGNAVTIIGTSSTTLGDFLLLNTPAIPSDSAADILVTANVGPTNVYDPHVVGVFYIGNTWAIFNEDQAPMPLGATFNVIAFTTHQVTATPGVNADVNGSYVFLDDVNYNNQPNLRLMVAPNWGPNAVNDPHPIDVQYFFGRWIIWNADGATMPPGATFNVWATYPSCLHVSRRGDC